MAGMFDNIAGTYDLLNHMLSLNIDKYWRNKAIACLDLKDSGKILDLATGTGDLAIAAMKLNPESITGIDISREMMAIGETKVKKLNMSGKISFICAQAEKIPFDNEYFSAVISAFGIRNFSGLKMSLLESFRVLKPGGVICILEFSKPRFYLIRQLYYIYFRWILPFAGGLVSGNRKAYSYLPESVSSFPEGEEFISHLREAGFRNCSFKTLSGGIATIYRGVKS